MTIKALTEMQSFCSPLSWLKLNPHVASCIRTLILDDTLTLSHSWTRGEVDSCTANKFFLVCERADIILFRNLCWAPCTLHDVPSCHLGLQDSLMRLAVAFDNVVVQQAEWDLKMVPRYSRHCDSVFISHTCWELHKVPIIGPAALQAHFPA